MHTVLVCGQPLDDELVSWLEVVAFEEVPPGAAAAEDLFVRCYVGSYRSRKAFEVQGQHRAGAVSGVGRADRVGGEEVQVGSEVDVIVGEVALGERHHDVRASDTRERRPRTLLRS
jgi:hypothetical protein